MREVLYRKYRPAKLSEVKAQTHITKSLENAIKSNKISHGYLFSGPRGVGKTSVARILANCINNFTDDDTSAKLDIIEIDAASNRRIEEIRDLRDKINIPPVIGKYKVYIIDEVHMLTREAFNALLKTLEEPPAHVVFILATTEIHKLPETIISRTQHYNFKAISDAEIVKQLKMIAKSENICIQEDSLELIAKHSDGSFRDSVSLLDQLSNISTKDISIDDIEKLLGLPSKLLIKELIEAAEAGDIKKINTSFKKTETMGTDAKVLCKYLIEELRNRLYQFGSKNLLELANNLINVNLQIEPKKAIELAILDFAFNQIENNEPTKKIEEKNPKLDSLISIPSNTEVKIKKNSKNEAIDNTVVSENIVRDKDPTLLWEEVLSRLKTQYNTLYGIARMANIEFNNDELVLYVKFNFHQKKLQDSKNKKILNTVINEVFNKNIEYTVKTLTNEAHTATKDLDIASVEVTTPSITDIGNISKVFGGGEILET